MMRPSGSTTRARSGMLPSSSSAASRPEPRSSSIPYAPAVTPRQSCQVWLGSILGPARDRVADFLSYCRVSQGCDVSELAPLGYVLEQPAHDLARARLR